MQNDSSQSKAKSIQGEESPKTIIGLFPTDRKAHEAGLAILAAGGHYWVYPFEGKFALVVVSSDAGRLKDEVRIYTSRNRFWPPVSASLPEKEISPLPTYLFAGMLIAVFLLQGSYPSLDDLGMNSSSSFWRDGEWWRPGTAITLHADLGHLVGNLFGIILFGYFASRYLGNGLAWLSILLTAVLSNFTNLLIHLDSIFLSLGASTAVFAALGLVTGFPIGSYLRTGNQITRRQWIIPLAGGLMLLAWFGSGTFPTDVAGHFWSFLYGLLLAVALARFRAHARLTPGGQKILVLIHWFLIAACWMAAIAHSS